MKVTTQAFTVMLYDPKKLACFSSHRWNVGTKPYLAFARFGQDSLLLD